MGVHFLIGRAGTSKTQTCAREIRALMAADPLGPPLLWITPQQATFSAERLLLTGDSSPGNPHPRGSFRAQVLSFRRLALQILNHSPDFATPPLGDLARLILLEEIVRKRRGELQVFSAVSDRPGFIEKLDATLHELREHGHTGQSLRQLVTPQFDAVTQRKLADLALLLDAWAAALDAAGTFDFEMLLQQAAIATGQLPLIAATQIWVDAFSALSALETNLLVSLGQHAQKLTITLLADPDSPALQSLRAISHDASVFTRTERMHRTLTDAFRKANVPIAQTLYLRQSHRFTAPALRRIESDLFSDNPAEPATPNLFTAIAQPQVEIWECSDPETEVRIAAQTIRELVTRTASENEPPLRYRDIGLIVPDLEGDGGYHDALRRVFTEHKIPHFIDQRRGIAHHPLVELLKSAVAIVTNRWKRDDLLLYLKSGLAGINESDVARVENYLLAHGIDRLPWSTPWQWFAPNQKEDDDLEIPDHARELLQQVNKVRQTVFTDLQPWLALCEKTSADPAASADPYIQGLRDLFLRLKVEPQINAWIVSARAADPELAQLHDQAFRQIHDLLNMLETLLKNSPRTLPQFENLLTSALQSLTLGLIPPTVDQVLVSSVTRSRVPELQVALILGAIEGQFPKVVPEDPILSDQQRETINDHSLSPIDLGADRQLLEMPFFDYVAFTRASRRLIVSYPLANTQGKAISKSRYLPRLHELLGPLATTRFFDAASRTALDRIATLDDLLSGVLSWSRNTIHRRRETLEENTKHETPNTKPEDAPAQTALYNWLVTAPEKILQQARQQVWPALTDKSLPQLAPATAALFHPPQKPLRLSVSQLEKFAACPHQYFLHYTLGLRPRELLELDTLNLGLLYHRILERLYQQIIAGKIPWPNCDPALLRAALEKETDAAGEELHAELAQRTPAYDQMLARTKRTLAIIVEGQRRRAAQGKLQPLGVEVTFGSSKIENGGGRKSKMGGGENSLSLPVLQIPTPAGHTVQLIGKIDRVDSSPPPSTHAAVIDYKSASQKSLDLPWILTGLALQLPVYALVMQDLLKLQPVAALYLPLGLKRQSAPRPDEGPEPGTDPFFQKTKPTGIIDDAAATQLDSTFHDKSKSDWFKMSYNKDGSISKKGCDLFLHADFTAILNFVRWKIADLADDLFHGRIAPAPYRDGKQIPCDHCDFKSLCPFDHVAGAYRDIPKLKRDEALEQMRSAPKPSTTKRP